MLKPVKGRPKVKAHPRFADGAPQASTAGAASTQTGPCGHVLGAQCRIIRFPGGAEEAQGWLQACQALDQGALPRGGADGSETESLGLLLRRTCSARMVLADRDPETEQEGHAAFGLRETDSAPCDMRLKQ
jgi:hypothetical protein